MLFAQSEDWIPLQRSLKTYAERTGGTLAAKTLRSTGGVVIGGKAYLGGWNSEGIQHKIQNDWFHDSSIPFTDQRIINASHFQTVNENDPGKPFTYFGTLNPFGLIY